MSDYENDDDLDARLIQEMKKDFFEEAQEHLDKLTLDLIKLENSPDDKDLIDDIFRILHTLKGTSAFVGMDQMTILAHKTEDIFGAIRQDVLIITPEICDIMFEALGVLTILRENALSSNPVKIDLSSIIRKLNDILKKNSEDSFLFKMIDEDPGKDLVDKNSSRETSSFERRVFAQDTIRVSIDKLNPLINLVGEMVTSRNRLNEFSDRLGNEELSSISWIIDRITGQLQSAVMGIRMLPIDYLFNKFPGVVRNLARDRKKEVKLIIKGRETELDKTLIEQIYDPLVHLIRNCIDHGIEKPEIRKKKEKPSKGQIILSARHQDNNVIIEVSDDGAGIQPEKLKEIAINKDLITKKYAEAMTDEQAIQLIFSPGFSTAENITNISGRGVGMDVVKEGLQRLRGMIDMSSSIDKGTTFKMKIPLTLAILQVLLVKVGKLVYALPLNMVNKTMLITPQDIKTVEKNEVICIRSLVYPLKSLGSILGLGEQQAKKLNFIPVVIVGLAEKKVALSVDELLDKQEIVIKSFGDYLGQVKGAEGAAILADGSVTFVVDVEAILSIGKE
ncbi:two-component system, chemotaxis family, sensor kinase CheA [Candidatus Magnetomoraceae bacterium gMMP-13]